uniref:NADH-ubiquinone oxidoreductase chain 1 n=1 Tax=Holarthrothrips indicus TaxID=1965675 RepID=A0A8A5LBL2_9NEOP|nr:NADH dehydrogenase subunit 1 [Holarthrothrips indicus]
MHWFQSVTFLNLLISTISTLIAVAFVTLMERKILGYSQIRVGPNKVGMMGILQPFSDAIKLYTKEHNFPTKSNFLFYYISPVMSLTFSLMCWFMMPYFKSILNLNLGILFFLAIMGMGVYSIMIAGWSSNSNYALLGSLRCVAQTISYEVSLSFILLCLLIIPLSMNFYNFMKIQKYMMFIILVPLFLMWFTSCLAELNRTPFDFAEGESELVSGFNIEYSGGGFAIIFMAEYSSILFLSTMTSIMFLGSNIYSFYFFILINMVSFSFMWMRATMPRFRYDKLMYLTWKLFLPSVLSFLIFMICVSTTI